MGSKADASLDRKLNVRGKSTQGRTFWKLGDSPGGVGGHSAKPEAGLFTTLLEHLRGPMI